MGKQGEGTEVGIWKCGRNWKKGRVEFIGVEGGGEEEKVLMFEIILVKVKAWHN